MEIRGLKKLSRLIQSEREGILAEWRNKVRQLPSAKDVETPVLQNHIPVLLDDLAVALVDTPSATSEQRAMEVASEIHGVQRFQAGFNIVEVVTEYSLLREVIKDFAARNHIEIDDPRIAHTIDRIIDRATALAIQTYSDHKTVELQRRREEHFSFVVHDLKTPLSALYTAAKILGERLTSEQQTGLVQTMLEMILRNVTRLNAIISTAIQESANLESPEWLRVERRHIDLWPLVQSLIDDLKPLADETSTLLTNAVPEALSVFADASLLTQALQNLLSNAIKYTNHGQVDIGARVISEDGSIECWVSDTGAGIPEDRLEKIFAKLETDRSRKGGLGLGLAIVKQVVEAHGGEVKVKSKIGVGSTFRFTLPVAAQPDLSQPIPA